MKANSGYGSKICGYETYPSKAQRTQPNEYHVDVTMQKGILRPNRESKTPIRDSYPNIYEFDQQQYPTLQKLPAIRKQSNWKNILNCVIRPVISEFATLVCSVFIYKHVEVQLFERQISFFSRIGILSVLDAIIAGIYVNALKTVQINPAITLAQLFLLKTSWFSCVLLLVIQFLGGVCGIALFYFSHSGLFPSLPKLILDSDGDYNDGATELITCQFIGTLGAVLSALSMTKTEGGNLIYVAKLNKSSAGFVAAVCLSSFLSLLHSNISWNPINAVSLTLFHYIRGNNTFVWHNHYVYWLGPALGSMVASFLYRVLFDAKSESDKNEDTKL